jgi:hypothetical protein
MERGYANGQMKTPQIGQKEEWLYLDSNSRATSVMRRRINGLVRIVNLKPGKNRKGGADMRVLIRVLVTGLVFFSVTIAEAAEPNFGMKANPSQVLVPGMTNVPGYEGEDYFDEKFSTAKRLGDLIGSYREMGLQYGFQADVEICENFENEHWPQLKRMYGYKGFTPTELVKNILRYANEGHKFSAEMKDFQDGIAMGARYEYMKGSYPSYTEIKGILRSLLRDDFFLELEEISPSIKPSHVMIYAINHEYIVAYHSPPFYKGKHPSFREANHGCNGFWANEGITGNSKVYTAQECQYSATNKTWRNRHHVAYVAIPTDNEGNLIGNIVFNHVGAGGISMCGQAVGVVVDKESGLAKDCLFVTAQTSGCVRPWGVGEKCAKPYRSASPPYKYYDEADPGNVPNPQYNPDYVDLVEKSLSFGVGSYVMIGHVVHQAESPEQGVEFIGRGTDRYRKYHPNRASVQRGRTVHCMITGQRSAYVVETAADHWYPRKPGENGETLDVNGDGTFIVFANNYHAKESYGPDGLKDTRAITFKDESNNEVWTATGMLRYNANWDTGSKKRFYTFFHLLKTDFANDISVDTIKNYILPAHFNRQLNDDASLNTHDNAVWQDPRNSAYVNPPDADLDNVADSSIIACCSHRGKVPQQGDLAEAVPGGSSNSNIIVDHKALRVYYLVGWPCIYRDHEDALAEKGYRWFEIDLNKYLEKY